MTTTFLADLDIDQIHSHDLNPRKAVGDITDLTASIKAHGVLEPLVVAPNGHGYQLITGHRRLAAADKAGLDAVPVVVRADLDTEPKQLEAMLIENTQRVDLTPVEEATAYAQLVAFPGYTPAKAAKATGRSVKTVKSRLAISTLPAAALERIHDGQISLRDAEVIAEFAGTSQLDKVVAAAGLTNFEWTVQRAREVIAGEAALATIREYCTTKKWGTVTKRPMDAETVIAAWRLPDGDLPAALDKLRGKHILWDDGDGQWALMKAWPTRDTSTTSTSSSPAAAKTPEEKARDKRQEDINTARTVRMQFLAGRLDKLILKDAERLAMLRLLVEDQVSMQPGHGALVAAGIDVADDDDLYTNAEAWIAAAGETPLWKALLVLQLQLDTCGSTFGAWGHETSIRAAIALGYKPSDIERELLAAGAKDGAQ